MSIRHVFVYGTLREGEARDINRLRPAPRRLGTARVPGMLYNLGQYPGLLTGDVGSVHGEVYEISAELERLLDQIEEVWPQPSGEYIKREKILRLDQSHEQIRCILYEVAADRLADALLIVGGDWVVYRLNSGLFAETPELANFTSHPKVS